MQELKVIQIGLGPLGIKTALYTAERTGITTIAAVDKNPDLIGKSLYDLNPQLAGEVHIHQDLEEAIRDQHPDVALLTTVSDMERITPQIEEIVAAGIPVVTTCEELSYPWDEAAPLARRIDTAARAHGVAVLGTGINPGFLMDSLPAMLTAVCQQVDTIEVRRFQDASFRRVPFQKKIGAGLSPKAFAAKQAEGSLRHVGLTESMQFIAHQLGWTLDRTEDIISPVITATDMQTKAMQVPAGYATGVQQIGRAYVGDELKIKLHFRAAVGEAASYDEIVIKGIPNITSRIEGGVNGDIATCAIVVNAARAIVKAKPGLRTMADVGLVFWWER